MFDTSAHEKVVDHKHDVSHLIIIEHKVCGIVAYIWKCASFMQNMMNMMNV